MLLSLEQGLFLEENGSKRNLIKVLNPQRGKMVFALLDKFIAIYIKLILVYVGGSGLKRPFSRFIKEFSSWNNKSPKL